MLNIYLLLPGLNHFFGHHKYAKMYMTWSLSSMSLWLHREKTGTVYKSEIAILKELGKYPSRDKKNDRRIRVVP